LGRRAVIVIGITAIDAVLVEDGRGNRRSARPGELRPIDDGPEATDRVVALEQVDSSAWQEARQIESDIDELARVDPARRRIFARGTRRICFRSAPVNGCASGSASAAASISASVRRVNGAAGRVSSTPSAFTRTSVPSRRIFAKVDCLFISSCLSSRDDPNVLVPFRVIDGQHLAGRHAKQNDSLFAIVLARIDPLDRERVLKSRGGLRKAHTVFVKIRGFLISIPFRIPALPYYGLPVVCK
jgi:hypothetical protein